MKKSMLGLAVAVALSVGAFALAKDAVGPLSYRSWQHVKSMVISDKKHGLYGFHHVYVEPKALAALQAGKGYPEGAQLAVPFYDVKEEGGAIHQGALVWVATMKRDKAQKDTGGWLFAAFDADGQPKALDVKTGCFTCHQARKDRDYVFTEWAPR